MTPEQIHEIVTERIHEWGRILEEEHATPMVMIGVGHDHRAGEIQLCRPIGDLLMDDDVIELLERVVALLRAAPSAC